MRIWSFIKSLFGVKPPMIMVQPVEAPEINGIPGFYLGKVKGAYPNEIEIIKSAVQLVAEVVRSDHFYKQVIAAKFTSTNGKSNLEIYQAFTTRAITVNVAMFTGSFMQNRVYHTVGYDNDDEFVHANRYFVQDANTLGSLIIHEVAHSLGFHHESASESTSVPYSMNKIFESTQIKLSFRKPKTPNAYTGADRHAYGNTNTYAKTDSNPNGDTHSNAGSDNHGNTYADCDTDGDPNPIGYSNGYPCC